MIELEELRDAARKAFPVDKLTPPRDACWQLVTEMGWLMIELAEDHGGLELGRAAAAAVHFELGKVLPAVPLAPALAALQGIAASPELSDRNDWIERICGGEYISFNMLPGTAATDENASLNGRVAGVFEADMASHVLVATRGRYDLVPTDAEGVTVVERDLWDPSRRIFDLVLDGYKTTPELVVALGEDAVQLHDAMSPTVQLAIAADSLGAANALFDMTVDYLQTRKQFGRPLALFQALKHRVADLKVKLESAEALLWSRVDADATMPELGALKAHCNAAFRDVAEEAIQLHGGIGLTEEHPCHLFLKRALLNCTLAGDTMYWEGATGRALLAQT
ncbi:acyl-CoA dehydrogenase family protein [Erythrobacter alti]|uniref:acyl-CoA dehydrogenase family protein n=1 Tax=Erythrobacter alti TaxID=1896145 RepID=UPI0030F3DBC7